MTEDQLTDDLTNHDEDVTLSTARRQARNFTLYVCLVKLGLGLLLLMGVAGYGPFDQAP